MSATAAAFQALLNTMGSDVTFHREDGGFACSCLSPEGFRSPAWHKAHPYEPVCNEEGTLPVLTEFVVKASVQPIRSSTRRAVERAVELFGEVQQDDHLGIFPVEWNGKAVDFFGWSDSGSDYILYDGRRFFAVAYDKLPDVDGNPSHHWEVGLRLVSGDRTYTGTQPPPHNTATPVAAGTVDEGNVVSVSNGTWDGGIIYPIVFTYQWQRGPSNAGPWVNIPGAVGQNYVLAGADVNNYVRALVTATNPGGSTTVASSTLGPVTPSLPVFPVISRGLPFASSQGGQFGGPNAESNAIDADYGTTWNSIFTPNNSDGTPNGPTPQWYVLDLRGINPATKSDLWFFWKSKFGFYYDGTSPLGGRGDSAFISMPRNYKLQGHVSSGAQPGVNDAGWIDLVTVVDNRYNARVHTGLDLSTYNWFRFYCTGSNGVAGFSDGVNIEFDLRDARFGSEDSIFWYGDSITQAGFSAMRPGNTPWLNVGPFENEIEQRTGRTAPVSIDGGIIGWHADDGDTNKVVFVGANPCHVVGIAFGTNDANAAAVDLTTIGGVNSAYAQNFKAKMQSIINYAVGQGRICIIPHIPWGSVSSFSAPNVGVLNQIIDQILADPVNSGHVFPGPDLFTFFFNNQNTIQTDHIHPTYDNAVPAGLDPVNGWTGYENLIDMWATTMIARFYS